MMAKKYEKHSTDDGKFQSNVDEYGHGMGNGKSRQAVSKNYDKIIDTLGQTVAEAERPAETEPEPIEEEGPVAEGEMPPAPEWLNVEFDASGDAEQVESIPAPIRGLLATMSGQTDPQAVKTPAQIQAWYAQQARLVRYFLAGVVDPAVTWWGRGITADPDYKLERSHQEWEMTEAITEQFLTHNQISVMVNPNLLMGGMIAALYVPPVVKIVKARDPNRTGMVGGFFQRWKSRRAIKKALKENPHLTREDVDVDVE